MRNTFLLLLLLSTDIGLSAQQTLPPVQTTVIRPLASSACPVNFDAQLNSRFIKRAAGEVRKHDDAPLLQLTFGQLSAPEILSATVAIHGLSPSSRYMPVNEPSGANRTQTFQLDQTPGSAGLGHTEVLVTQMRFVRWAEVTALNYADGTTWHPSSHEQCRAVPSNFHLVN
ncbi:MAG TPA: hypothetical protein VGU67_02660 [Edaphobacter sp.]|nr:hypothetical protein [Edaphobacter sp.]